MNWNNIRKILCIRADNMGDVIMSGPAMRALKETFNCSITLLTSTAGAPVAKHVTVIDEVIIADLPWVKNNTSFAAADCTKLIYRLQQMQFDAAIIFTVYSQSALPSAMLAFMAGIPLRLAYSRENPYQLLTHWIPDKEPYTFIRHQVKRDLLLVKETGATTLKDHLFLHTSEASHEAVQQKLEACGIPDVKECIIIHTAVSEEKRAFPVEKWQALLPALYEATGKTMLLTGTAGQHDFIENIMGKIAHCINCAGMFSMAEFIALIERSPLIITVNTSAVHIAAATQTPAVVLYALTNPQHTSWKSAAHTLYYPVAAEISSRNEIVKYVQEIISKDCNSLPCTAEIVEAALSLLASPVNNTTQ